MTFIKEALSTIKGTNHKFVGSPFEEWSAAHTVSKGAAGERVAKGALEEAGFDVKPRDSKTHDLIADGKRYEVKTSFESRDHDGFLVYGFDPTSDASYWLVQLIRPTSIVGYRLDRTTWANLYIRKSGGGGTLTDFTEAEMIEAGATCLYRYADIQ